jgi:hypothetical protein
MVTDEDRARVRGIALERARFDGERALRADLREGEQLIGETTRVEVIDQEADGAIGDAAASVKFRARVRVSGSVYDRATLERVALSAWQPETPVRHFVPAGVTRVGAPVVARMDGEASVLRVPMTATAVPELDANQVRDTVRGRSADQARRDLARTLPLAAEPRVRVEPALFSAAPWRVDLALDLNPPPRG